MDMSVLNIDELNFDKDALFNELLPALLKCNTIRNNSNRELVKELLPDELYGKFLPNGTIEIQVWSLIEVCNNYSKLSYLLKCIGMVESHTKSWLEVERVVKKLQLTALRIFGKTELEELKLVIKKGGWAQAELEIAARLSLPPRTSLILAGTTDEEGILEEILRNLNDIAQQAGEVLAVLSFAAHLLENSGQQAETRQKAGLIAWLEKASAQHNQQEEVKELRKDLRQVALPQYYLLIKIKPCDSNKYPDPDQFSLIAWLDRCDGNPTPLRLDDSPLAIKQLEEISNECYQKCRQQLGINMDNLIVEVFLPCNLLDRPVETWEVDIAYKFKKQTMKLGQKHPVVVRAYERTVKDFEDELKPSWQKGWQKLEACRCKTQPAKGFICDSIHCQDEESFSANLRVDNESFYLGMTLPLLPYPKDENVWHVIDTVYLEGTPVVLWVREPAGDVDEVKKHYHKLLKGEKLAQLPRQVYNLRLEAAASLNLQHPCRQIVLLLDDPTRPPPDEEANKDRAVSMPPPANN
ncbi:MAG: hypothetical protein WCS37_07035 [Chloroflexota bacterium]|nr:hypothetical protein [Chloroflexota bacterium]